MKLIQLAQKSVQWWVSVGVMMTLWINNSREQLTNAQHNVLLR
jgi:hypothetical protein